MAAIDILDDGDVLLPSRLPGWTVGHVLSHVARNADSHRRRAEAAAHGLVVEQYPGGFAGRAEEIDRGASSPVDELRADLRVSAAELDAVWRAIPEEAWDNPTTDVAGRQRPLRLLVPRRWPELEIHLVDLGVGPTQRDWTDEFVADRLPALRARMPDRLPAGAPAPGSGSLDERDELAWLYGRLQLDGLPVLAPWG